MRSLLALQIPEHVTGGGNGGNGSGYHMALHHVPLDSAGNVYMEGDLEMEKKQQQQRDKLRNPTMWSRPKLVGIATNDKHKSSLKKPIPKSGLGTDFSIAV